MGKYKPYAIETQEQAEFALKDFCKHVSEGKPQYSWYLDNDIVRCCDNTLLTTMKERPELFDTVKKDIAFRQSYSIWFDKGRKMTDGEVKGSYSPQVWQAIMRNMFSRFGWWVSDGETDKSNQNAEAVSAINKLASALKSSARDPSSSKASKEDQSQ